MLIIFKSVANFTRASIAARVFAALPYSSAFAEIKRSNARDSSFSLMPSSDIFADIRKSAYAISYAFFAAFFFLAGFEH